MVKDFMERTETRDMAPYKSGLINRPIRRVVNVDVGVDPVDEIPQRPADESKLVSLEIIEDDGCGGDPYNHTGSHCVVTLADD